MAVRYYVCPIIGTGTEDDPYRAAVEDQRINYSAEIPTGPDGRPLDTTCVVAVDEKDAETVERIAGVEAVTDLSGARLAVEAQRGPIRKR